MANLNINLSDITCYKGYVSSTKSASKDGDYYPAAAARAAAEAVNLRKTDGTLKAEDETITTKQCGLKYTIGAKSISTYPYVKDDEKYYGYSVSASSSRSGFMLVAPINIRDITSNLKTAKFTLACKELVSSTSNYRFAITRTLPTAWTESIALNSGETSVLATITSTSATIDLTSSFNNAYNNRGTATTLYLVIHPNNTTTDRKSFELSSLSLAYELNFTNIGKATISSVVTNGKSGYTNILSKNVDGVNGKVTITWSAAAAGVSNVVTGYQVLCNNSVIGSTDGAHLTLTWTPGNSYIDSHRGTTLNFMIRAIGQHNSTDSSTKSINVSTAIQSGKLAFEVRKVSGVLKAFYYKTIGDNNVYQWYYKSGSSWVAFDFTTQFSLAPQIYEFAAKDKYGELLEIGSVSINNTYIEVTTAAQLQNYITHSTYSGYNSSGSLVKNFTKTINFNTNTLNFSSIDIITKYTQTSWSTSFPNITYSTTTASVDFNIIAKEMLSHTSSRILVYMHFDYYIYNNTSNANITQCYKIEDKSPWDTVNNNRYYVLYDDRNITGQSIGIQYFTDDNICYINNTIVCKYNYDTSISSTNSLLTLRQGNTIVYQGRGTISGYNTLTFSNISGLSDNVNYNCTVSVCNSQFEKASFTNSAIVKITPVTFNTTLTLSKTINKITDLLNGIPTFVVGGYTQQSGMIDEYIIGCQINNNNYELGGAHVSSSVAGGKLTLSVPNNERVNFINGLWNICSKNKGTDTYKFYLSVKDIFGSTTKSLFKECVVNNYIAPVIDNITIDSYYGNIHNLPIYPGCNIKFTANLHSYIQQAYPIEVQINRGTGFVSNFISSSASPVSAASQIVQFAIAGNTNSAVILTGGVVTNLTFNKSIQSIEFGVNEDPSRLVNRSFRLTTTDFMSETITYTNGLFVFRPGNLRLNQVTLTENTSGTIATSAISCPSTLGMYSTIAFNTTSNTGVWCKFLATLYDGATNLGYTDDNSQALIQCVHESNYYYLINAGRRGIGRTYQFEPGWIKKQFNFKITVQLCYGTSAVEIGSYSWFTNIYTVYNSIPTVNYRKNRLDINCTATTTTNLTDAVLVINGGIGKTESEVGHSKVYLYYDSAPVGVMELTEDGIILSGGVW